MFPAFMPHADTPARAQRRGRTLLFLPREDQMGYNLAPLRCLRPRSEDECTAGLLEKSMDEEAVRCGIDESRTKRKRMDVDG